MASHIDGWHLSLSLSSNLTPGGWAEFQDFDLCVKPYDETVRETDDPVRWGRLVVQAAHQAGLEPSPGPRLEGWVREAGFVNVTHRRFKIPSSAWPKDAALKKLGAYLLAVNLQGLEGYSLRLLCDVLGWKEAEVHVLLAGVRRMLKDVRWHGFWE